MTSARRELDALLLAALAAVPLYLTEVVSPLLVASFHLGLGAAALALVTGRGLSTISSMARAAAIIYLPFFFLDAAVFSRSLIKASSHLLFFIALYQALDTTARRAPLQRLLVTFLIFVTSLATATHLSVMLYVLVFTVLAFRQLIAMTRDQVEAEMETRGARPAVGRTALLFALPTALIAILLFPALPRMRNPMVRGITTGVSAANTGISDTIDFRQNRSISADPSAVARVWVPQEAIPFVAPLRLRVRVYDQWKEGAWSAALSDRDVVRAVDGTIPLARRAVSFSATMRIEQQNVLQGRLFLPEGTWEVEGFRALSATDAYALASAYAGADEYDYAARVSITTRPLLARPPLRLSYPMDPRIAQLATEVVGPAVTPREKAARIETWMRTTFRYLADPAELGRPVSVEEFLLSTRRGHCEYFAAGMVVMLSASGVPARIVGGFYGGDFNPLIGSFVLRQRDAHAWTEVWDDERWVTYDSTPAELRPGTATRGLLRAYTDAIRDSVTYFWDRYILTFGAEDQIALIANALYRLRDALRGGRTDLLSGWREIPRSWWIGAILALAPIGLAIRAWRLRRRSTWERLVDLLREQGVEAGDATAPGELLDDVRARAPALAPHVERVLDAYLADRFSAHGASERARYEASHAMRELVRATR